MSKDKIDWGKEILQTGNEIAQISKDVGIPGIGLLGRFAQKFYDQYLQRRFEKFISDAELDHTLIDQILADEMT